jgi:hypothetical protein
MKPFIMVCLFTVALGASAISQESRENSRKDTAVFSWQGYLVDANSAREIMKDSINAMKNASEYARSSALKEENQNAGFGIVVEGKWLKFDRGGDSKAAELVKATTTEKGIKVTVSGRLDGQSVAVLSLKEDVPDNTVGGH